MRIPDRQYRPYSHSRSSVHFHPIPPLKYFHSSQSWLTGPLRFYTLHCLLSYCPSRYPSINVNRHCCVTSTSLNSGHEHICSLGFNNHDPSNAPKISSFNLFEASFGLPYLFFDSYDSCPTDFASLLGLSVNSSLCWSSLISELVFHSFHKVSFLFLARRFLTAPHLLHLNTAVVCGVELRQQLWHFLTASIRSSSS